jgi:hypothetical protein
VIGAVVFVEATIVAVLGLITLLTVRRGLFWLIQVVSVHLTILGWFVVGLLALLEAWEKPPLSAQWHWDSRIFWIWDNDVDGIAPPGTIPSTWSAFLWSALRNPCNNLRFVPGVSKAGRPLWYWTRAGLRVYTLKIGSWSLSTPTQVYAKAGWLSDGYPALSAGAGRGY